MPQAAYVIENLAKRYKPDQPPANDRISLTVYQGEVFGLLGPNGAGKTTLVRQMAGLSRPDSGAIRLFGLDLVKDPAQASRWVAVQPQGLALPRAERPRTLLEVTGQLRGLSPAEARRESTALLDEFNLGAHAEKPFYDLSGGLRRLVSIATALIGRRPVLIFDEPTNDLDPEVRRVVWRRIRRAAQEGATIVLVTHNVVEAEQALDRVAIVRAGQILAVGTPGALKGQVASRVRLELLFGPEHMVDAPALLDAWPEFQPMGARRYGLVVDRAQAEAAISHILPSLDLLDDFRIVTPNLEDVYLELTGGEQLGA